MSRAKTVVITGASAGIGRALAVAHAGPGRRLGLVGRRPEALDETAELCRAAGATVETALIDVRSRTMLADWLLAFDAATPVDRLVAAAGVKCGLGPGRGREAEGESHRLADVNYKGMLNTVEPLLEPMRARRAGHVAVFSSLAGFRPVPDMPSYSATKAAVGAYGVAIRGWLRRSGVAVSVIMPGYVTSAMTARQSGWKPFEISMDYAVRRIVLGLDRRRATIVVPRRLHGLLVLDKLLPPAISDWFLRPYEGNIEPDDGR